MNPADKIALTERIARALVWLELEEHQRVAARRRAAAVLDEIETGQRQTERIGWMLVETDPGGEEAEAGG